MAAGGRDRLSELPDDLLRRILHFAPLKEAASTTALSRRWRASRPLLWLSSGALNLETGVERYYDTLRHSRFFTRRDAFVTAAAGALDAADAPVTRLTLRRHIDEEVLSRSDFINVVLSHRAARRVEELRLVAKKSSDDNYYYRRRRGLHKVTLESLPMDTLRVLEVSNCKGILYDVAPVVLPRLSSLRLSHSVQQLSTLQRIIDAAPALAAVHLESVDTAEEEGKGATTRRLRCLAANVLVLDSINVDEIDAPRLRRFRYKGPLLPVSFSSPLLELEHVDIDFSEHGNKEDNNKDPNRDLETFWRFARSFTCTKEMRLRLNHLEDTAVLTEARRVDLLPTFRRLERLEVHGAHWGKGKDAALATLNLLRCCPVLSALRINLTAKHDDKTRVSQKEIQIAALLGPHHHLFRCLRSSLKRVGLQFHVEKSDCLGVKLINFFAENAMVLEEMYIDTEEKTLSEHMKLKTEKWNSKRRKLGASCFVVLPLNSRFYKEREI